MGVRTTKFSNTGHGKTAVFESMSASMKVYRDAPQPVGFAMPGEVGIEGATWFCILLTTLDVSEDNYLPSST